MSVLVLVLLVLVFICHDSTTLVVGQANSATAGQRSVSRQWWTALYYVTLQPTVQFVPELCLCEAVVCSLRHDVN
jgi:hypothetical protein